MNRIENKFVQESPKEYKCQFKFDKERRTVQEGYFDKKSSWLSKREKNILPKSKKKSASVHSPQDAKGREVYEKVSVYPLKKMYKNSSQYDAV